MLILATVLVVCFLVNMAVIYLANRIDIGIDKELKGAQKFHTAPTPRIGGVAVFVSVGVGALLTSNDAVVLLWMAGSIAFIGGIAEDFTHKVSPFWRLICTFFSAGMAFWLVDAELRRVGVVGFNELFAYFTIASLIFTAFAVGGVAHSVNIIDGYNGLMLGFCLLAFVTFALLNYMLGDGFLVNVCLLGVASTIGLMLWNYPFGKIFCGDGGAYFLGFWLAEIAVLTVNRHEEVSPWFGFMVMAYPIIETLFAIYRKKIVRNMSPSLPDRVHLHMLVYQRIVRAKFRKSLITQVMQNSLTSPLLWIFSIIPSIWALVFWDSTGLLLVGLLGFITLYLLVYARLVRFGYRIKTQAKSKLRR